MAKARKQQKNNEEQQKAAAGIADESAAAAAAAAAAAGEAVVRHQKLCLSIDLDKRRIYGSSPPLSQLFILICFYMFA